MFLVVVLPLQGAPPPPPEESPSPQDSNKHMQDSASDGQTGMRSTKVGNDQLEQHQEKELEERVRGVGEGGFGEDGEKGGQEENKDFSFPSGLSGLSQ